MQTEPDSELEAEIGRLRHGQHLCVFYDTPASAHNTVAPFFRDGLAQNDRCLFIADEESARATRALLVRAGVDDERELKRGALTILQVREAYLPNGRFDARAMVEFLEQEIDRALEDGFAGLRASGDMAWALGPEPGTEQLVEYEAVLNDVAARRPFLGICRYGLQRFPPSTLRDMLRVHPQVVIASLVCPSTHYEPPGMVLGRVSEDERLRWAIGQLHAARAAKLELERAVEGHDRALRARDEFLAVAAHELRTPLTTLSLQLQSLAREVERRAIEGGLDKKIKAALRGSRHLTALVENMLDISRVATGHTELSLHIERVDLREIVEDVEERFRAEVAIHVAAEAPVVGCWDRLRLDEVVTNLVANGVKYGRGQPIEITLARRDDRAHLAVRDRGIGIGPESHARIFEAFERAVSSDHYGGLGLGLFITRRIVEAHGGTIRVESARGEGSTFFVELPVAP